MKDLNNKGYFILNGKLYIDEIFNYHFMKKITDMGKQKPEFSKTITKNKSLLLSYDKLAPTEGDFREDLIVFLIDNNASNLQCFVATTIYFETANVDNTLTHWSNILNDRFGETFYFHLVLLNKDAHDKALYVEYKRDELATNFKEKVDEYIASKKK